jgi:TDG/mug DNA glycosylase family protein
MNGSADVLVGCFPPVAADDATVLILGSMPGKRSLDAQQYYAHPQNAFWKIIGELTGTPPHTPYARRLQALQAAHIALWDVLHSCVRHGSLDSDIEQEQANDFETFFAQHPHITRVFFNGAKAEQSFRKFVLGKQTLPPLELVRLPSTSPAHAGMRYEEKLETWKAAVDFRA